ncbi:hypothetical protein A0257_19400 [Hymenobacter psoromatis]|nr:hypothetical protein A0257_19400 [Hymenobacter psoromatis]
MYQRVFFCKEPWPAQPLVTRPAARTSSIAGRASKWRFIDSFTARFFTKIVFFRSDNRAFFFF